MIDAKLIVIGGEAKTCELNLELPCTIGRGKEATITLPHPLVSRLHCELYEQDGLLYVKDLKSLNGTFINNRRIEGEHVINPRELLTLGNVTFRVIYEVDAEIDLDVEPDAAATMMIQVDDPAASKDSTIPVDEVKLDDDVQASEKVVAASDAESDAKKQAREEQLRRRKEKLLAAKKLEAKKLEAKKLEAKKLEAKKLEAKKLEAKKLEAKKLEARKAKARKLARLAEEKEKAGADGEKQKTNPVAKPAAKKSSRKPSPGENPDRKKRAKPGKVAVGKIAAQQKSTAKPASGTKPSKSAPRTPAPDVLINDPDLPPAERSISVSALDELQVDEQKAAALSFAGGIDLGDEAEKSKVDAFEIDLDENASEELSSEDSRLGSFIRKLPR